MSSPAQKGEAATIHALFQEPTSPEYSAVGPVPQPPLPLPEPWSGAALLRVQRAVGLVCRLGDRPVFEVFAEIARNYNLADEIAELLGRFTALDPDLVDALGDQDFPPVPLHEVPPR